MARFGFCGPSYQALSPNADAQMTVNLYPERNESGAGKSEWQLYATPGLANFATFPETNIRGLWTLNDRTFGIGGTKFCEIASNGSVTALGTVANDGLMGSLAAGPTYLSLASGGHLYALRLSDNNFTEIDTTTGAALRGAVSQVAFSDGFFGALLSNSQKFQISSLEDPTTWNPLDIGQVSVFPDNVVSIIVDHREAWLFGRTKTVPYYDSGNALFPFDVIPGAFIEQGISAGASCVKLDNTVFWLGGDDRGNGIAWRAQGYLPVRVSNHAVETAWQGYSTISDAIGYSYQDQGHGFWVLRFPTANKTWVYDAATQMWHERRSMVGSVEGSHFSQCHTFNFGKHLVGDWNSANVYQMSVSLLDDAGIPIKRVRRAPYVSSEQEFIYHRQLQVDVETGLGPQPPLVDGNGNPRAPQMMLRWSNDSHTWSNEHWADCGKAGEFLTRVLWRRLGRSRARVYEISMTDPVPWRIVDAYLQAEPGFEPTERLASQFRKSA